MDWTDALEIRVARTRNERYRVLTADDHPDREAWRRRVVEEAAADEGRPMPAYPPFMQQVGNALAAAGRVVAAVAQGQSVRVPDEVYESRLALCRACNKFDAAQGRCTACGCVGAMKLRLAQERCPLDPPKWEEYRDGSTDR